MQCVNATGLALIKSFESFRSRPYRDEGGVWTIGYGHTKNVGADIPPIAEEEGERLLREDLAWAENAVSTRISVSLSNNQYAALVSLVYNAGPAPLARTLGAKLNAGDIAGAADEFRRWVLAGGITSDGLARRRRAERDLFLTPDD